MAFERIKTVKGKQYKYLVENVRENGKVKQKIVKYLGRADKEPVKPNVEGYTLPYGFYYLSQEQCSNCDSKEAVEEDFTNLRGVIKQFTGEDVPQVQYVNLTNEDNPMPIHMMSLGTPSLFYCGEEGVYFNSGNIGIWYYWTTWMFGKETADKIHEVFMTKDMRERKEYFDTIRKMIRDGTTNKEFKEMGFDNDIIRDLRKEIKDEKMTSEEKENRRKQIIQKEKERLDKLNGEGECKDGVCPLPSSNANVTTT